jgi:hypothetical protein
LQAIRNEQDKKLINDIKYLLGKVTEQDERIAAMEIQHKQDIEHLKAEHEQEIDALTIRVDSLEKPRRSKRIFNLKRKN